MSSSFVTQCPHCRTRFRVNHAQLGAANGAVRCGACMHVFNAAQHLVADQPVARTPADPAAAPTPPGSDPARGTSASGTPTGKKPSDTLWIHDDLDIDDIDLDEELARLEREEVQFSQDFLALAKAPKPAQALLGAEPATSDPLDERWAEALLNENSSETAMPPSAATATPAALAQAASDADLAAAPAGPDDDPQQLPDEPFDAFPDVSLDRLQPAAQTLRADASEAPASIARRQRAEPSASQDDAFELIDEPLQLDWRPKARPRGRLWLWGLLNLLALALLAGQYVLHNFADLARQDQYRPWFAQACPLLGCQLPSKVDIEQIKSSNLMVRPHPQFAGALIVDAIIYNRAPFAQPFPLLEMRFADLQGQAIASRRFKPAEYLAGELAGKTEMPSQTPIRIALEILDPGRHAENYSLNFLSPE